MPNMIDLLMGTTPRQREQQFFDQELPELANRFYQTNPQDAEGHQRNAVELMQRVGKAGLSDKVFETILNQLTAPARAKTSQHVYDEIDAGRKQRGGMIREENITGRGPLEGADDSLQAFRTQGDFNQDDALKLGRAEAQHGIKIPAHLAENLRVPSQVAAEGALKRKRAHEASVQRTENRIAEMQADQLERLGEEAGIVGRATRGRGLAPYIDDERDRVQMQPKVDSDVGLNRARTTTEAAGSGS